MVAGGSAVPSVRRARDVRTVATDSVGADCSPRPLGVRLFIDGDSFPVVVVVVDVRMPVNPHIDKVEVVQL